MSDRFMLLLGAFGLLLVILIQGTQINKDEKKHKLIDLKLDKKNKAHGVIFGKQGHKVMYSPIEVEKHILCTAGSGCGKTSALLIPTLRSWQGTSFTIDISGDISRNCPDMPDKVVFEPENDSTIPYDVFASVDCISDVDKQDEALVQLAQTLIPEPPNMSANAKYFADGGRKILAGALIYGYRKGSDFCRICYNVVASNWQDLFSEILDGDVPKAKMYLNSFLGANDQNTAGCYQQACDAVQLFATSVDVAHSVHRPFEGETALTPNNIEDKNIFIVIQDEKLELYAPLLNIIVAQFMQYISMRPVPPKGDPHYDDFTWVLMALDEFASLSIDDQTMLAALRKYRKKKVRIMALTQSLADIILLYGHDATRAMLANFKYTLLLGGLGDLESLKYFAEVIGYKKTTKRSISHSSRDTSRTESEDKEYIIEPADLDRMGDKAVLISEEGHFVLDKNFYYK